MQVELINDNSYKVLREATEEWPKDSDGWRQVCGENRQVVGFIFWNKRFTRSDATITFINQTKK